MKNKLLHLIKIGMYYSMMGFMLQVILLSTVLAVNTSAQDVKSVRDIYISLDINNLDAIQAFEAIESKTNYKFAYEKRMINRDVRINYKADNQSLAEILTQISKITNLKFRQVNNNIDVKRINRNEKKVERVEIMTQTRTITGKVTAFDTDEGLPGVNVVEKGTSNGTVTDLDGNYSLAVKEGSTLVFSSVGYTSEEVEVGGRSVIDLTMTQDIQQLQELVVVGYGTQTRADITSAVSTVKGKDIENIPVTAVDAMLQGKAAGVQVVQNSGAPGAENYVRIRGNSSLLGQNRPLYIVDGVQMNNITSTGLSNGGQLPTTTNDINPNDIESMEILKDAAATAIYGARASNGVILITTKRGKQGATKFSFDAYTGVQEVWKKLDLLNAEQYVDLREEAIANEVALTGQSFATPSWLRVTGIDTDWQNEIFRTALISDYNFSANGGNDKTKFFISAGYFDQKGTIIEQAYNRANLRINLDHKVNDKIKMGLNFTTSLSNNDQVFADFDTRNPLAAALVFNPNLPVRNEDGSYAQDPLNEVPNPVQLAEDITFNSKQKRVLGNVFAEYDIIENLSLRTTLSVDFLQDRQQRFAPTTVTGFEFGEAVGGNFEQFLWNSETTLTYKKIINNKHDITAMAGISFLEREEYLLRTSGNNPGTNIINTIAVSNFTGIENYLTTYGLLSYFGRVNYTFDNKILLMASLRVDGSSRFDPDQRYGYFPAASAGYRLSEESFMDGLTFIDDLKFRASFGITGNQDIFTDDFPSLAKYSPGNDYASSWPGIAQSSLANPLLTWESTTQFNFGIDLSVLNSRINLMADIYRKTTNDLLFRLPMPWSSGYEDTFDNIGSMVNEGLELVIGTENIRGAFTWSSNFNIAYNRNEITMLPYFDPENPTASDFSQQQPDGLGTDGTRTVFRMGESFGSFYGYKVLGVDPNTGFIQYENVDGSVDDDGDPSLGISDRQIFGNALPLHTGGFTNNFAYKNFDLNVFMQWSYGNDIYNQTAAALNNMTDFYNQSANVLNRWQEPGDITDVPIALVTDPTGFAATGANNREISSRFLEDGSFLRLKNVTLGYNVPATLLNRFNLSSLRLYVSGRNLLTFTDYTGFDPESQNTSVQSAVGVDYLVQPQPRTYIVGLNLQF